VGQSRRADERGQFGQEEEEWGNKEAQVGGAKESRGGAAGVARQGGLGLHAGRRQAGAARDGLRAEGGPGAGLPVGAGERRRPRGGCAGRGRRDAVVAAVAPALGAAAGAARAGQARGPAALQGLGGRARDPGVLARVPEREGDVAAVGRAVGGRVHAGPRRRGLPGGR